MTAFAATFPPLAKRLIEKFGTAIIYIQDSRGSYSPATGQYASEDENQYSVKGIVANFNRALIDGTHIRLGDLQVVVAADALSVTPAPGDHLSFDSTTYSVVACEAIYSGDKAALYTLQVRK